MKQITSATLAVILSAAITGCGPAENSKPAADTSSATAPAAAPATSPAPATAAVVETAKAAVNDLSAKLVEQAKAAADSQLGPIASELTAKVQSLGAALGTGSAVQSKLDETLKSLIGGQDATALTGAFQLAEAAKFTPQQLSLAKEVGNLASAFVVQKNFSALEGAQGDVATIVNSLRKGEITAAIPALKNVATNANLTSGQKQLITTVADKYAPGWQQAKGAVDALKKLPGF